MAPHFIVYGVQYGFAYFPYLAFGGIDETALWVVLKIILVIFKSDESNVLR